MPEVHISSLLVHVRPEREAAARLAIAALPGAEIHGSRAGKLVVVLEAASETETLARIAEIHEIPGTIAASLIYHEIDDSRGAAVELEEKTHG